jgi:hypothetical protein
MSPRTENWAEPNHPLEPEADPDQIYCRRNSAMRRSIIVVKLFQA